MLYRYHVVRNQVPLKNLSLPHSPVTPAAEAAAGSTAPSLPDLSGCSGVSIVDGLKSVGADSSYAYRKTLAEQLGIQGYSGTAAQNLELLRKLGEIWGEGEAM